MHHGIPVTKKGSQDVFLASGDTPTSFGILFEQDRSQPSVEALKKLAETMVEPPGPPTADLDSTQPAGFTFFGQFVDHDITLSAGTPPDPDGVFDFSTVHNGRTPRLDLDSVFGTGPAYSDSAPLYDPATLRLRLGEGGFGPPAQEVAAADLPEGASPSVSRTLGDPRNSENLIIAQLHTVFMRLYNRFLGHTPGAAGDLARYEAARRKTVQHYQHVVLNDYLPRIAGRAAVDAAMLRDVPRYRHMVSQCPTKLIMPVEFAFAAFRFGHSQVRGGYSLNMGTGGQPRGRRLFVPGDLDLNGSHPITEDARINWDFFFELSELSGDEPTVPRNFSRRFDAKLAGALANLKPPGIPDGTEPVLATRNLLRGRAACLPSGQAVARAIGAVPLSNDQLGLETLDPAVREEIEAHTPLWYYVLREAEVVGGGKRLAGTGAYILAETFVGLLLHDENSILNQPFTPEPGLETLAGICATVWPNRGRGPNDAD
ncbi:hypothetical protein HHL28_04970 [Aerophototrophica crusticola]|uniref:Heme peroxidase n=1 Tax=Aerophototrophica crusticola TaxID=1709002 RepID=A0A858R557_9PROT|nr:hypothetical protein HHL28_04970 [Rhodospirillaceae bacterium B3]